MTATVPRRSTSAGSFRSTRKSADITSRQLRRIMAAALADLADPLDDPLPEDIRTEHGFPDLRTCLQRIHFPAADDNIDELNHRAVAATIAGSSSKSSFCWS